MAPCCNPLTLQPEQSGGRGSNPPAPCERHEKGTWIRLALSYSCDPSGIPALGAENCSFSFTFTFTLNIFSNSLNRIRFYQLLSRGIRIFLIRQTFNRSYYSSLYRFLQTSDSEEHKFFFRLLSLPRGYFQLRSSIQRFLR